MSSRPLRFRRRRGVAAIRPGQLGHLWMVANPPQHPGGDFGIADDGLAVAGRPGASFTWSGIGIFRPASSPS